MKGLLCLTLLLAGEIFAQTYDTNNVVVRTFAGSGFSGWVDGVGTQTMFSYPAQVVAGSSNTLFVLDNLNWRIRKATSDGTVSTFAGGGTGSLPGYGTNVSLSARFDSSSSMAIDRSNTLWITSEVNLLRIGSDGHVSYYPLNGLYPSRVCGVCVDSAMNVYLSSGNRIYRSRTSGIWEVFAGSGNIGSADGNGVFTSFNSPTALTSDAADNIYVWDTGNHLIRRISSNRDVVTLAGKLGMLSNADGLGPNATFHSISGMCVDGLGNVILACGSSVRKLTPTANVVTMAGSFQQTGYTNGAGSIARFRNATGVCVSQGMAFVADSSDHRIRELAFDPVPQPVSGADLELNMYPGLRISGNVGRAYRIESSLNMTNWSSETTILLTTSPYLWIDPNSLGQKKFYRAFLLP